MYRKTSRKNRARPWTSFSSSCLLMRRLSQPKLEMQGMHRSHCWQSKFSSGPSFRIMHSWHCKQDLNDFRSLSGPWSESGETDRGPTIPDASKPFLTMAEYWASPAYACWTCETVATAGTLITIYSLTWIENFNFWRSKIIFNESGIWPSHTSLLLSLFRPAFKWRSSEYLLFLPRFAGSDFSISFFF